MITVEEFKHTLIDEGMVGARKDPNMKKEEQEGSCIGFQACGELDSPEEFEMELQGRHRADLLRYSEGVPAEVYWAHRYATIQIEWVYEVMKIAWMMLGGKQYETYSARAMIRFNEIMSQHGGQLDMTEEREEDTDQEGGGALEDDRGYY